VFLAVTGGEALYADLGHFGRKPIQAGWLYFVLPSLLINYFGQGALVLSNPAAIENSFYRMVPEILLLPLVVLATAATVIASQAVITGAYSLTRQAVQLGLLPRFEGPLYLGDARRPDLSAARERLLLIGVFAAGAAVSHLEQSGFRLRDRRSRPPWLPTASWFRGDLEVVELARRQRRGADRAVRRRRYDFFQRQSPETARRRVGAAAVSGSPWRS